MCPDGFGKCFDVTGPDGEGEPAHGARDVLQRLEQQGERGRRQELSDMENSSNGTQVSNKIHDQRLNYVL